MAITTTEFISQVVDALVDQGVVLADAVALKATLVTSMNDWLGSPDALVANMAQKATQAFADFQAEIASRYDFWFGDPDGGPNSDGFYDLTLTDGTTVLNPCLARVLDMQGVAPAASAVASVGVTIAAASNEDVFDAAVTAKRRWFRNRGLNDATYVLGADATGASTELTIFAGERVTLGYSSTEKLSVYSVGGTIIEGEEWS